MPYVLCSMLLYMIWLLSCKLCLCALVCVYVLVLVVLLCVLLDRMFFLKCSGHIVVIVLLSELICFALCIFALAFAGSVLMCPLYVTMCSCCACYYSVFIVAWMIFMFNTISLPGTADENKPVRLNLAHLCDWT